MMAYIKAGTAKITDDGDVLYVAILSPTKNPDSPLPLMIEDATENPVEIDMDGLSAENELIHDNDIIYAISWDSGKKTDFGSIDELKKFVGN